MQINYKFTDTEINKLLKENFMILFDTRERENLWILDYFDKKKIKYKRQKLDEGDYSAIITKRPEMGIYRDLYFPVAVERKASVDELASNLGEKKEDYRDEIRLIRELQRAKTKGTKMFLIIEDIDGMNKIKTGNYRSQYQPKAFLGKLSSIQDLYLSDTIFTNNSNTGFEILRKLHYSVRNFLKEGNLEIAPEE
jgi:ERCC4-type nuclease